MRTTDRLDACFRQTKVLDLAFGRVDPEVPIEDVAGTVKLGG